MTVRVACVVPAYQAERTVGGVLAGLRAALPEARLIVVDDGSRDGTSRESAAHADDVVRFADNRGKGAALRAGLARALAADATHLLTIDADGQHDPARAPALLAALDDADVASGDRARGRSAMPMRRRVTNRLATAAVSRCAGRPVPDAQCGYRAMRATVAREVRAAGDRYEYETEFLILAGRAGFRIVGVPVPTIYGAPSHFREFSDAMRVIRTIWRHRSAT